MKSLEMQPTHENVFETLIHGRIGRTDDVFRFVEFLNSIDGSFSVALDGRWGSGKTFFVKQVKMVLDSYNDHTASILTEEQKEEINRTAGSSQVFAGKQVEIEPQVTVYYDAWSNDNDDDPLLSIIYEILTSLSVTYDISDITGITDLAAAVFDAVTGRNTQSLLGKLKVADPLKAIREEKSLQEKINDFINEAINERGNRMVVFVDELDRCRPDFAVRLLERIKHYFANDRVTFVFSINSQALQHTIRKHYGEGFDASRYTDRFFDLTMELPKIKKDYFLSNIVINSTAYVIDSVRKRVVEKYHFEMREILRFYKYTSVSIKRSDILGQAHRPDSNLILSFVVPIAIALKMSNVDQYEKFVQGQYSEPLVEILGDPRWGGQCQKLLGRDETFQKGNQHGLKEVEQRDKVEAFYYALFALDYTDISEHGLSIGETWVDEDSRAEFFTIMSCLSPNADYSN